MWLGDWGGGTEDQAVVAGGGGEARLLPPFELLVETVGRTAEDNSFIAELELRVLELPRDALRQGLLLVLLRESQEGLAHGQLLCIVGSESECDGLPQPGLFLTLLGCLGGSCGLRGGFGLEVDRLDEFDEV